jgi:DMSO/TMAO reductase YedYZ molybdopterin-dependent catalytic subunit
MTDLPASLARRRLLAGSAGALAAAGLGTWSAGVSAQARPLPAYASWKDPSSVVVHSSNTIEVKRSALGTSVVTPSDRLFVRNNLPPPDASIVADPNAWELTVEGVKNPRKLTVAELKTMGIETVTMVLQCSGNGRGFFPSKPSGTAWTVGAAGCVVWSGVPVRAVAEALGGVASGMVYLTGTGGEKLPEGVDAKSVVIERSVPIKTTGDALLAWELNGAPIPLAHGGPLRLIVPGFTGVNNIKYVKRLAFTAAESDAKIMSHGYRISPPGTTANPSQPSVQEMGVKSWINTPNPDSGTLAAGRLQVTGVAFGGVHAVKRVEVSTDGGKTWRDARFFGPDLGQYAWREFVLPVQLTAGTYTITSRATDAAGNVQPELRVENLGGYNNASWVDHAVKVTIA